MTATTTTTTTATEPAIKSYFFGKGYSDLGAVIKDSWRRNIQSSKLFFKRIDSSGEWYITAMNFVFWGGAGISVMFFGTLVFALISIIHVTILSLFFGSIYLAFTAVWLLEEGLLFMRQLLVTCPHCHKRNHLPQYYCDNCGEVHSKLNPNGYGIFYHRCKCGHKLPSSFLVNRGKLQARCPNDQCHQMLHRDQFEAKKICLPIMGGPYAGKTAFMFAVVRQLIEQRAEEMGYETAFLDSQNENDYNRVLNELKQGTVPGKTVASIPKAFNLALKKGGKTHWLLYVYDPSGETYENTDNLTGHHYKEYMNGMILILDPFSIVAVRRHYEQQLSKTWNSVNPSQLSVQDALTRILLTMEASYGLGKTDKIKKPLAVVLSKIDAFDLETIIGEQAVDSAIKNAINNPTGNAIDNAMNNAKSTLTRRDVRNALIRQQLADWGESSLLQQLDMRFKNIQFFTCSALGRIPDGRQQDLMPDHVIEPVNWLLNTVSSKDFSD